MTPQTIADPCRAGTPPLPALAGGVEDGARLVLPHGLLGFPEVAAYRMEAIPATLGRFVRLSALGAPGLSFLLMPEPASTALLDHDDLVEGCHAAGIELEDAAVFFIVTLRQGEALEVFINRRAPLFVDAQRGLGAQVVLPRGDYALRHPVVQGRD